MIGVTISIPKRMWKSGRTFYILRVHDGRTTVLAQTKAHKAIIKTNRFSTYAIAYSDVQKQTVEEMEFALNKGLKVSQYGKSIGIKWSKVPGVDGYHIYVAYCGTNFKKKPSKVVKSASVTSVKIKKINGKKLKLKKNFKVFVKPYRIVKGKKVEVCRSIIAHVVGKNNKKFSNVK
jgi:hypothetical protein